MNGLYWISNLGYVKNKYNHILKPDYSNKGYARVVLCNHIQNMRAYTKNHPDSSCNKQFIYCFDLDKVFSSASEASIHTGVCRTSIVKACRGQLHKAGGMLWCYAKDKDIKFPL